MIKTKQPLYLPLNKQAMRWLPKRGDAQVDDKVFPEVSKVHRETITKWAESAGITKHVTYHLRRHGEFSFLLKFKYLQFFAA